MKSLKVGRKYIVEFKIKEGEGISSSYPEEIYVANESGIYYKINFLDKNQTQWIEKKAFYKKTDRFEYGYLVRRMIT